MQDPLAPSHGPAPASDASGSVLDTTLRHVAHQLPAAVIVVETSGRLLCGTALVRQIWGEAEPWTGLHRDGRPCTSEESPIVRAIRLGEHVRDEEIDVVRSDGTRVAIRMSAAPLRNDAGTIVAGIAVLSDITAQRVAEDRAERLASVTTLLSGAGRLNEVFDIIVREGLEALGAYGGGLLLLDEERANLRLVLGVGFAKEVLDAYEHVPLTTRNAAAEAARTGAPVFLHGEEWESRYGRPLMATSRSKSLAALPLMRSGQPIGVLTLAFARRQRFAEPDRRFMLALSHACASAVDRARLYESEREARNQAEAASREKDEFLAVLSHELRTPLSAVLGWAHMLLTRNELAPESVRQGLTVIERNARAQVRLIDDLIDVSRIVTRRLALDLQPLALAPLVRTAVESLRPQAEARQIALSFDARAGDSEVHADADRIQQVVVNLLSNAMKFTEPGGWVRVTLDVCDDQAIVEVADNGIGITPEALPRIFDRFRQGDSSSTRQHGGLGLGLAICRHLVDAHGGRISGESEGPGRGARFTIALPLRRAAHAKGAAATAVVPTFEQRLAGIRVLLAGLRADEAALCRLALQQSGAEVRFRPAGDSNATALRAWSPDAVVFDAADAAVLAELRAILGPALPAIALAAREHAPPGPPDSAADYARWLTKPIHPVTLLEAVAQLTRRPRGADAAG